MTLSNHFIRLAFATIISGFLLSGCYLVSEQEIILKGEEINISDGEYIIETLKLEKSDFSKLKTKLEEPKIQNLTASKTGNIFSRSYEYKLKDATFKFVKLDHKELKNMYLVQIKGADTFNPKPNSKSNNIKFIYMHAKFDNDSNVVIYPMFNNEKDLKNFTIKSGFKLEKIDKNEEMDLGVRQILGDQKVAYKQLVKFASTVSSKMELPIFSLKPLCKGEKKSWNKCNGRTVEKKAQGTPNEFFETKIGPYSNGLENGKFFRKREFTIKRNGKTPPSWFISGLYKLGKFEGWWLYKSRDSKSRIIKFENGKAKYIHEKDVKGKSETKGHLWDSDPGMLGSLRSGFVVEIRKSGTQKLIGLFDKVDKGKTLGIPTAHSRGLLTEGIIKNKNTEHVGTFDDEGGIKLGQLSIKDKKGDVYTDVYSGEFLKSKLQIGSIKNPNCENIGRFKSISNRNETITTSNVEGKVVCNDGTTKIGRRSNICPEYGWRIIFKEQKDSFFYGVKDPLCKNWETGIFINKKTRKVYAVKSQPGTNKMKVLKELNLDTIIRENNLE